MAPFILKNDKLTLWKILGCAVGLLGILAVNTEKMSFTFALDGELMMTLSENCMSTDYGNAREVEKIYSFIEED